MRRLECECLQRQLHASFRLGHSFSTVRFSVAFRFQIALLAEGRLVNLGAAEGHPASVMDMSFANQALCAEYVARNHGSLTPQVYDVPTEIDEEIAALKLRSMGFVANYLMPLGLWQYWAMFSPDPVHDTVKLEGVVLDAKGLLHNFAFPTEEERSRLDAALHYRHSKFMSNFSHRLEFKAHREFAPRHVVRQLNLPDDAFPLTVQLVYRIRPSPPPGGPMPDPMTPITTSVLDTYQFPSMKEVQP